MMNEPELLEIFQRYLEVTERGEGSLEFIAEDVVDVIQDCFEPF